MSIYDAVNDPGFQTVAVHLQHIELPSYVREADDVAVKQAGGIHGFAIPKQRKLPCGTKAACYLSHAFFLAQRDSLPTAVQSEADKQLARFADMHGITADVSKLAQHMSPGTEKIASAVDVARRLSHCGVENQDRQMPGELIRAARELVQGDKTARDVTFCRQWVFDMPFNNLSQDIRLLKLANKDQTQCDRLDVLSSKVAGMSQTKQLRAMDTIADALFLIMEHKTAAQTWNAMKNWHRNDIPAVRVGRVDVPYTVLESKLAQIEAATGLPVVKPGLFALPVDNWVDVIEGCDPKQAQQIQSLFVPAMV